jgi:hypothetical protein
MNEPHVIEGVAHHETAEVARALRKATQFSISADSAEADGHPESQDGYDRVDGGNHLDPQLLQSRIQGIGTVASISNQADGQIH